MSSNGQQRPIKVPLTSTELDELRLTELAQEEAAAWEAAWNADGNGAGMNAYDD